MPPPTYNPVWLDEFGADASAAQRLTLERQEDAPRVLVHSTAGGASYHRQSSLNEHSDVKVPLLTSSSTTSGGGGSASSGSADASYQSTRDCSYGDQTRPLLNRSSLVECRYQSTQDSGYEQSQDECNFPPPLDLDYPPHHHHDPLSEEPYSPAPYDPPPPEVAFETSLDYAYEQDLAQGVYGGRPSEDDGYAESCASSSHCASSQPSTGVVGGDPKTCDHARNQCAYMNTSPFGDFIPPTGHHSACGNNSMAAGGGACNNNAPIATVSGSSTIVGTSVEGLQNGSLSHSSPRGRYATSLSPAHTNHLGGSPAHNHHHHQQNGTLPPPPIYDPAARDMPPCDGQTSSPARLPSQGHLQGQQQGQQGQGGSQQPGSRNTARLTLDGLDLEIQVAPQNCYSGFAPETILRASKARQRCPQPAACNIVNPEDVGEIILSDVSREVSLTPEPDFKGPARMCRNCCLRVAAFIAHVGFFVCVAILGVQIPLKKRYDVQIFILRHDENAQRELEKPYDEVALVTACVMLFLCYLVALGESYTADTESFVSNAMSREVLQSYMRELRDQVPIVGWDVICYHLETRQVTRTTRDRWGNETTSTTEEEVKVMTHRETLRFPFRIVKDISGDINLKGTAITKMEFHQMYGFLDMATAQKFTQIKEKLKERNRYRDEKMEFKEIFAMDNLKAHVTVFGEYGCLRQLMRPKIFCFFSCFLFSWPFRLLLKLTTKKKKYTVIKVLGL